MINLNNNNNMIVRSNTNNDITLMLRIVGHHGPNLNTQPVMGHHGPSWAISDN